MTDEKNLERLARIETHLETLATTLKQIAADHEGRIRHLEGDNSRMHGILKLVSFIGAPGVAALVVFFATKG